jgi:EAL domain-containing protein (putative c-di-GMP-specific phosphodiesterase class I)
MYMAKRGGKGRYQLFDAEGYDRMAHRAALRADLATAVAARQLRLEYQPVADLGTGEILGVEALVRWEHPTLGRLEPTEFIPLAEETGDIDAIGCWVLKTATRQAAGWRSSMPHCEHLWVSVNLSTLQLPSQVNLAAIEAILSEPAAQADRVVLEVTETALASSVDGGVTALKRLKSFGVRIAVDDFGTGFSSLSTLAELPADILKIDRSFLAGPVSDGPSAAMLEGILGLAHKLDLDVVAEGIEDRHQLELLRGLGCHMGQGFLLGRPAASPVIEALLASGARLPPPDVRQL